MNVERYYGVGHLKKVKKRRKFQFYNFFQPAPEGFAAALLDIARETLGFEDRHVENIVVEGYVCIPAKGCYDPNDVGGHCCPLADKQ